jgi:hypothetical protein
MRSGNRESGMKSKKAFIKLNGEIGEKEQPCIEYVDKSYTEKIGQQKKEINDLLLKLSFKESKESLKE